jgi:hypothetical protein
VARSRHPLASRNDIFQQYLRGLPVLYSFSISSQVTLQSNDQRTTLRRMARSPACLGDLSSPRPAPAPTPKPMHVSTHGVDLLYSLTYAIRKTRHADLMTTTLSVWLVEAVDPLTTSPTVYLQAGTDQGAGATRAVGFCTGLDREVLHQYSQ